MEKSLKGRIVHKHDTEANWNKAVNFIPLKGELIVYDIDEAHSYERIKIGDGIQNVDDLSFYNDGFVSYNKQTLTDEQKAQARENIGAGEYITLPLEPYKYEEQVHSGNGKTYAFLYINVEDMYEGALYGVVPDTNIYRYYIYFNVICDDGTEKRLVSFSDAITDKRFKVLFSYSQYTGNKIFLYDDNMLYTADITNKSTADNVIVSFQNNLRYLYVNNYAEYVPTGDYNPATKKYVDDSVNAVSSLVGDTAVSEQISTAISDSVADWNQTDETAVDYIKNKPEIATDDEIIELLTQEDMLSVVADSDGAILADENSNILLW